MMTPTEAMRKPEKFVIHADNASVTAPITGACTARSAMRFAFESALGTGIVAVPQQLDAAVEMFVGKTTPARLDALVAEGEGTRR